MKVLQKNSMMYVVNPNRNLKLQMSTASKKGSRGNQLIGNRLSKENR